MIDAIETGAYMDYEAALEKFEELLEKEKQTLFSDRNEATTRLQLVDALIFDCLGWDRRECISEESMDGLYADYTLGTPIRFAIWEAKREGVSFTLPVGIDKRTYKIRALLEAEGGIGEAIKQVLRYCQQRGVAIGAVCNGHQVVAFLASRTDNIPPLAGQAIVFSSLDDIRKDFREFWDNLSRPGAESYNLHKVLRSELLPPPPGKLCQRIPRYPGFKNRNQFQSDLKNLGELFIEDLGKTPEQEEDFLRNCYSSSGALSQYALVSRQILQSGSGSVCFSTGRFSIRFCGIIAL